MVAVFGFHKYNRITSIVEISHYFTEHGLVRCVSCFRVASRFSIPARGECGVFRGFICISHTAIAYIAHNPAQWNNFIKFRSFKASWHGLNCTLTISLKSKMPAVTIPYSPPSKKTPINTHILKVNKTAYNLNLLCHTKLANSPPK